jgi:hypothetical protein
MAQIDTRHGERDVLFQILVAKYNNDLDTLLANVKAKMERQDVKEVLEQFEEWKKTRKN